jgi:hypothetical protein
MALTVACVLHEKGGTFTTLHAKALCAGVETHLPGARFACISTNPDVPGYVPMPRPDWTGKWSLVNWWTPGLFTGRVLAVGLDTFIVGPLDDLAAYDGPAAGIDDFYQMRLLASGAMAWDGDELAHVHEAFARDPRGTMRRYPRMDPWLRTVAPNLRRLQRRYPDQIVSYKAHARAAVPDGARVVCFHGKPRPHEATGWASVHWRRLVASVTAPQVVA